MLHVMRAVRSSLSETLRRATDHIHARQPLLLLNNRCCSVSSHFYTNYKFKGKEKSSISGWFQTDARECKVHFRAQLETKQKVELGIYAAEQNHVISSKSITSPPLNMTSTSRHMKSSLWSKYFTFLTFRNQMVKNGNWKDDTLFQIIYN